MFYKMKGAIQRMLHRKLSMAWEKWQEWYAEMKNQQHLMSGAANRLRNYHLSRAWEKWQEWYEEKVALLFRMQGAIRRMMNRQLSKAWEKWQFWYEEFMREKYLLNGAANRMRNFHLSRAWEQWQWFYQQVLAALAALEVEEPAYEEPAWIDTYVAPSKSTIKLIPVDKTWKATMDQGSGDLKSHPKDANRWCSPKRRQLAIEVEEQKAIRSAGCM